MKTAYPRVPFPLIVKATDGDVEAINQIVKHYRGYTSKRSLRRMTDEYGNSHMVIDETLRGRWKRNSSLRFYRSKLNSPIFSWKRVESYPRFPIWEVCYSIKAYCVFSRF